MKLSRSLLLVFLALVAQADEVVRPEYTPLELQTDAFFEQFNDSWASRWKASHSKRDNNFVYRGEWSVEEPVVNPGFKGDKGLVVKTEAAHHAISAVLPTPFDNTDNTLVFQYEVKLQKGLECGGAYVKLLSAEGGPSDSKEFNNDSPYQVMFGPDKCGMSNKVHFIIRRKNPVTGEYEEKHLKTPPMGRVVKTTSLYTLIIKPNQDFEIRINGEVAKAGSLLDSRYFDLTPPKEIDDPNDEKPADWVEDEMIPDPDAKKPEDWDEDAPYLIVDPTASKPDDWDEDAEAYIPDPDAVKPEYWDDEEDGEWLAPKIPNPFCEEHGCGPWTAPKIRNPEYKGKWTPELIENPAYIGPWAPRKIANPEYYEDPTPSNLEPIGALGFELWTMTDSILFDNIYLGHSIEEAEFIGNKTFVPKVEIEEQVAASNAPKAPFEPEKPQEFDTDKSVISDLFDNGVGYLSKVYASGKLYWADFLEDPAPTLLNRPGEAFLFSSVAVGTLTTIFALSATLVSIVSSLVTSPAPQPVKKTETAPKIELIDEKATATESKINETEAVKRG
ncbi:hypothetical protein OGAPHI_003931 [Ogataea philodendri]|uniref:Calnexin n=1 Tax=Ogataea philodendri TaxID=1378263 RepID=A0A9P8P593_9ASCO|nr:uncharacterized protein OGAPHI_003931 [Ogataea philodendri]KAH3665743.1 hypothetical protein OGAPHI_003931 [Ogataea philodendri]